MSAEELKQEGNVLLQNKEYQKAYEKYTSAIELDPNNHILFSNRSAASLYLNNHEQALLDAKECIKLNPTWAKGYARKGAALRAKSLFSQAATAYQMAAEFEGSGEVHESYKTSMAECELEDRIVRGVEQRQDTSSSSSQTTTTTTFVQFCFGNKESMLNTLLFLLRFVSLFASLFVIIPFGEIAVFMYEMIIIVSIVSFVIQLLMLHGRPRFDAQYAGPLIQDARFFKMMIGMIFFRVPPSIIPITVILMGEIGHFVDFIYKSASILSPSVAEYMERTARSSSLLAQYSGQTSLEQWRSLDSQNMWFKFNHATIMNNGRMEVALGFISILGAIAQQISLLTVIVLWQSLKVRCMTGHETRSAFKEVDERILSFIAPYPALQPYYEKLRLFLMKQAELPQQRT